MTRKMDDLGDIAERLQEFSAKSGRSFRHDFKGEDPPSREEIDLVVKYITWKGWVIVAPGGEYKDDSNPVMVSECQNCGRLFEHRMKDKLPNCPECGEFYWRRPPTGIRQSEPHKVSPPSTHEDVISSDNKVIKDAYTKSNKDVEVKMPKVTCSPVYAAPMDFDEPMEVSPMTPLAKLVQEALSLSRFFQLDNAWTPCDWEFESDRKRRIQKLQEAAGGYVQWKRKQESNPDGWKVEAVGVEVLNQAVRVGRLLSGPHYNRNDGDYAYISNELHGNLEKLQLVVGEYEEQRRRRIIDDALEQKKREEFDWRNDPNNAKALYQNFKEAEQKKQEEELKHAPPGTAAFELMSRTALALYQEYSSRVEEPISIPTPKECQYILVNDELWGKFCSAMSIYETSCMAEAHHEEEARDELRDIGVYKAAMKRGKEPVIKSCSNCGRPKDKPDHELAPCGLPCTNFDLWQPEGGKPEPVSTCGKCGGTGKVGIDIPGGSSVGEGPCSCEAGQAWAHENCRESEQEDPEWVIAKHASMCAVGKHEAGIEIGDFWTSMAICKHCRCYFSPRPEMRPPVEKKESKVEVIDRTPAGHPEDGPKVPSDKATSWLVWRRGHESDTELVKAQGWYNARNAGELHFRRKYPDLDIGEIIIEGKEVEDEAHL
jgi:DNA-directed RNA polymerase subunit RPC12/RpoP